MILLEKVSGVCLERWLLSVFFVHLCCRRRGDQSVGHDSWILLADTRQTVTLVKILKRARKQPETAQRERKKINLKSHFTSRGVTGRPIERPEKTFRKVIKIKLLGLKLGLQFIMSKTGLRWHTINNIYGPLVLPSRAGKPWVPAREMRGNGGCNVDGERSLPEHPSRFISKRLPLALM